MNYLPPLRDPVRTIGRRTFDFDHEIVVMAIVNRTQDSFFDHGRTFTLEHAVAAALDAAEAGAGWVDIGGVPFSPDMPEVTVAEEIDRVVPVVERVAAISDIVVSVDTFRAEVAARCVAAGAAVINDTTGLHDPELADVEAAQETAPARWRERRRAGPRGPSPAMDVWRRAHRARAEVPMVSWA